MGEKGLAWDGGGGSAKIDKTCVTGLSPIKCVSRRTVRKLVNVCSSCNGSCGSSCCRRCCCGCSNNRHSNNSKLLLLLLLLLLR